MNNREFDPSHTDREEKDIKKNPDRNTDSSPHDEDRPDNVRPGESGIDYWKRLNAEDRHDQDDEQPEQYWNGLDDHGFRPMNDPNYGPVPDEYVSNGMSRASMACGILSLVAMIFGGSLFFSLLGILFALLSRRKRFSRQAKTGLALSSATLIYFTVSVAVLFGTLVSTGSWNTIMQAAAETDLSDPTSLSEFQAQVYDAVLRAFGGNQQSGAVPPGWSSVLGIDEEDTESAEEAAESTDSGEESSETAADGGEDISESDAAAGEELSESDDASGEDPRVYTVGDTVTL